MIKPLALLAVTGAAALLPAIAQAQTAASPLTGNLTLASDYRFRGISQTFKQPALQGGLDWSSPGGFYLGNWNSNVSGNQYPNGAGLEMDFYGGYKFEVAKNVTLDIGGLYYYYPGAAYSGFPDEKFNNFEVYFGAASGPFSAKVYFAVTDFFGLNETVGGKDSSGSYYVDLNYTTEVMPKTSLVAHVGYQSVRNYSNLSYTDYKLGLTYDLQGWTLGAALVGTNADKAIYVASDSAGKTKKVGEPTLVLSIGKTF